MYNVRFLAYASHSGQQDIQAESTKPKTTRNMGKIQQQAPALPSENDTEV